jgi:hypothetical protein
MKRSSTKKEDKNNVVSRENYMKAVDAERSKLYKQVFVMTFLAVVVSVGFYFTVLEQKPISAKTL